MQVPPQVDIINRFEHTVETLARALEKIKTENKTKDTKLEVTKHVEAEKPRIRTSKLKYKLVDEVYVSLYVATILLTPPVQLR